MTASGTSVYPGLYKARCTANNGRTITVYIPQVFGKEPITMSEFTGDLPAAGSFGYVSFEGGDAAYPVWVSNPFGAQGNQGNQGFQGFQGFQGTQGNQGYQGLTGSVGPTGALTAFAGSDAPTGWLLCYGQAVSRATYAALYSVIGTTYGSGDGSTTFNIPDMRGRAPVALDNMGGSDAGRLSVTNTLGGTGGEEKHLLIVNEMPSHSHLAGLLATTSDGSHVHTLNTLAIGTTGSTHTHAAGSYDGTFGINNDLVTDGGGGTAYQALTPSGSPNGRIVTNTTGSTHTHNITGSLQTTGDHTHPVSGSTATEGAGGEHNNMQPYILTNYIIKT